MNCFPKKWGGGPPPPAFPCCSPISRPGGDTTYNSMSGTEWKQLFRGLRLGGGAAVQDIAVALLAAVMAGIDLGELRPQQENLRRIVDPEQQQDEAARRAIGRTHGAAPQIDADGGLPGEEQQRRAGRADPHVAPFQRTVRPTL